MFETLAANIGSSLTPFGNPQNLYLYSFYNIPISCVVASILGFIPYWLMTGIVILVLLIWDLDLFPKVDCFLLGTFICFFIFVDNMNRMPWINDLAQAVLDNYIAIYGYSALLSQVISNVPSAVLISGFTSHYKEVLIGVSVGGIGTLIASLANLISYKFYIREYPIKPYKQYFYWMNILGFIVIALAMAAWITMCNLFIFR